MITCFLEECNTFSQTDYDNAINLLPFHMLQCSCGRHGCLIKHGYYNRILKLNDHTIILLVLRVKCKECGKTHALLFTFIVPYSQVAMLEHISIIKNYLENKSNKALLDQNPDISERDKSFFAHNSSNFCNVSLSIRILNI